jgi:outer membrane protein TolC
MPRERHPARILALAFLSACSTVNRARSFQDPASAVPGERTPTAAELGLKSDGQVELDDLLRISLGVNPTVLQARRNVEISETHVRETESSYWPQTSVSAGAAYHDSKGHPSPHQFYSYGFNLSWLLFDFGHTNALVRNVAELWLAAQSDLKSAELTVAFNVRSAYINLARQVALLKVADETVHQFEVHLEQVHEFVQVGTRIPYDETKAQVDLGTAKLAQVKEKDAVLAAQASLANSIGLAEIVDWSPNFETRLPEIPDTFEASWELARQNQPTLASALAREQAANYLVDARIASLYPSLGLNFGFSGAGSQAPLPWSWSIGPSLAWIPFDGFQRLATIDEAVASLRSARSIRTQVEQQAWLDVRSAWLAIQDARERIDLTTLSVKNAEQNHDLAQELFNVGKGTSIDLADAAQLLAQARSDQVQAKADEYAAEAALLKALGLPFEDDKPAD